MTVVWISCWDQYPYRILSWRHMIEELNTTYCMSEEKAGGIKGVTDFGESIDCFANSKEQS